MKIQPCKHITKYFLLILSIWLILPALIMPQTKSLFEANFIGFKVLAQEPKPAQAKQDAENIEFVGHIGGYTNEVFVQNNYAYINEGPQMTIVDVSTPSAPVVVGQILLQERCISDIYVSGTIAYVACGGLALIDVSNPSNPNVLSFFWKLWSGSRCFRHNCLFSSR